MNEIQRLIHEMCPDGVPMVALGEVCEIKNGKDYKHLSPGNIPVWGTGGIMTYVDQYAYNGPSVLLPRKGSIDKVYYSEGPVWTVDTLFYTIINESIINPKYLYAVISMQDLRALDTSKGNRPSLTQTVLNKIQIPLPPLPIQQRIVEILDKFTSLVSSLDSEIALRQKQYEYYRNKLLSFEEGEEGVEWKKLSDVCIVINGRAYKQSELLDKGPYRVLRVGNFFSNDSWYYSDLELESKYYCVNGDLLYAWSASFGPHIWKEEKVIYHYHIWKLECQEPLDKKFMFYWLQSDNMTSQVSSEKHGATMAHLTKAMMEDLILPIPSLDRQRSIVRTLDTFESLLTNLKKERELRQKQYEYYREKLLTFA
jgi:type I restriction enzyme S subunit